MLTVPLERELMRRRLGVRPVLRFIPHPKKCLQQHPAERQAQILFEALGERKKGASHNVRYFHSTGRSLQQGV